MASLNWQTEKKNDVEKILYVTGHPVGIRVTRTSELAAAEYELVWYPSCESISDARYTSLFAAVEEAEKLGSAYLTIYRPVRWRGRRRR